MATELQGRKMKEERSNKTTRVSSCVLIIPRLLIKTMMTRKPGPKARKLFPGKVRSIFFCVVGKRRRSGTDPSNGGCHEVSSINGDELVNEETGRWKKLESDEMGTAGEGLMKTTELEDEEVKLQKWHNKLPPKVLLSLLGLFHGMIGLNYSMKNKINIVVPDGDGGKGVGAATDHMLKIARQESWGNFIPEVMMTPSQKMGLKPLNMETEQGGRGESEQVDDYELCKKRILMGRRCKPMSSSGV